MLNLLRMTFALAAALPHAGIVGTAPPAPGSTTARARPAAAIAGELLRSLTGEQVETLRRRGELALTAGELDAGQKQLVLALAASLAPVNGGVAAPAFRVRLAASGRSPGLLLERGRGAARQVLAERPLPAIACHW